MKKIIWICGPKDYENSGIGQYSSLMIKNLKKDGIEINDLRYDMKPTSKRRIIYEFLIMPIKLALFNQGDIIVLPSETYLPYTLFPFFPIKNTILIVHDIRDFALTSKNPTLLQKIYFKMVYRGLNNLSKAKSIIAVTNSTKKQVIEHSKVDNGKLFLIENSFEFPPTSFFDKDKEELKSQILEKYNLQKFKDKKIILNVGSEEDRKNIKTLIKAVDGLQDVVALKIGRPIIQSNREMHLEMLKNSDANFVFLDFIEREDLYYFYYISDLFVYPSLFEGFGRTPLEAQIFGCPVISSDKGGLKEVLLDSAIIIKDPMNPDEIKEKINTVLSNEELKNDLIKKGFENCKRFDINNNYKKFIPILSD